MVIKNLIDRLKSCEGVIAIEFSFIYIIFVGFVFILFELCKFLFILVAMDYSLSEAARNSAYTDNSTTNVNYKQVFNDYFFKQSRFWVMFIDPDAVTVETTFCSTAYDVAMGRCSSTFSQNRRLALYSVNYKYRPFKAISNLKWSESLFTHLDGYLTRKVVYMIESSR